MRIQDKIINYSTYDPDVPGVEIFYINRSYIDYHRHFHDTYMIGLVTNGAGHVLRRNKTDSLAVPGEIALMNPGVVHSGIPDKYDGLTYKSIQIDPRVVRKAGSDLLSKDIDFPEFKNFVVRDNIRLFNLLSKVCSLIEQGKHKLEKEINFMNFLEILISNHSNAVERRFSRYENPLIKRTKEVLSENLENRSISWTEVAHCIGLSPYYLNRKFKKEVGISPWDFRRVKKFEYAKKLLSSGMSLANVSVTAGFYDQSDLTKTFKQMTCITPGKYHLLEKGKVI